VVVAAMTWATSGRDFADMPGLIVDVFRDISDDLTERLQERRAARDRETAVGYRAGPRPPPMRFASPVFLAAMVWSMIWRDLQLPNMLKDFLLGAFDALDWEWYYLPERRANVDNWPPRPRRDTEPLFVPAATWAAAGRDIGDMPPWMADMLMDVLDALNERLGHRREPVGAREPPSHEALVEAPPQVNNGQPDDDPWHRQREDYHREGLRRRRELVERLEDDIGRWLYPLDHLDQRDILHIFIFYTLMLDEGNRRYMSRLGVDQRLLDFFMALRGSTYEVFRSFLL